MGDLEDRISELIDSRERDRDSIDRTLADGYAHVLALETERLRLERRLGEVVRDPCPDDQAQELSELATRLGGNAGALDELRGRLGELRRLRAAQPV